MSIDRKHLTRAALGLCFASALGAMTFVACTSTHEGAPLKENGRERVSRTEVSEDELDMQPAPAAKPGDAPVEQLAASGSVDSAKSRMQPTAAEMQRLSALGYHGGPYPHAVVHEERRDSYDRIEEDGFISPLSKPLSTFSIDVDTAAYSNVRRYLKEGLLPPSDAVRIEEFLNYFSYDYPKADRDVPISILTERTEAPWVPEHQLVMVGLKGVEFEAEEIPARNLTFLLDVSGSMQSPDKLDLVARAMKGLTKTMRPQDRIAIVVYAGASGLVLPPTAGDEREKIEDALEKLRAGGSTNGGEGIRLAYKTARRHFDPEGINRVILATDGDFNVGTTDRGDLVRLIEDERKSGVFLTVLGVGRGNLQDSQIEELADKGNGNYAYLDTIGEARKVLIREAGGTLVTVAKDVKIQVEFNPAKVASYRLIGYENRRLADRDFNDDTKDAGEVGSGHSVTALYEVVPHGVGRPVVDPLRYQRPEPEAKARGGEYGDEWLTVKVRYKQPDEDESQLLTQHLRGEVSKIDEASRDLRFAAAVATFGMLLRDSPHHGEADWELAAKLARGALGDDPHGDRAEFLYLVSEAREISEGMGS